MKLTAFVASLVLALPLTAADDDADKAAKKLEGTYELVSAIRGGQPDPKADDVEKFVIKDDTITISLKNNGKEMKAKFKLDPSKKPAEIDLAPEENGNKTLLAIYQTKDTDKGLELTIVFPRDGGGSTRPKDFKGESEDEVTVKLLRKKEK
jgi:uncharacterized protein (TIGR03067 family)